MTGIWRLRAAILVLAGALGVHHGRYAFATAEHEHELAAAHAYLPWLGAAAAILLFLAVVQLAAFLGRAEGEHAYALPRAGTLWTAATVCLLGVFGVQETVETFLAHGHLPELAEILGAGGWTAVPLALAAGAAIALLLRGAATALRWALERRRPVVRQAPLVLPAPRPPLLAAARSVLARRLAGRGPPALSSST